MTAMTATERLGVSILRVRLGAALQKHRLQRGLTQTELAEFAVLSSKYVGEIERGEANTTLEVLERLAAPNGPTRGSSPVRDDGQAAVRSPERSGSPRRGLPRIARWRKSFRKIKQLHEYGRYENA